MKIQLVSKDARIPTRAHTWDAGFDLYSSVDLWIEPGSHKLVETDVIVEIPEGCVGLVCPRSGLAAKESVSILNTPGIIDAGYRGTLKVNLINHGKVIKEVKVGDRIAQLVLQKVELPILELVGDLSEQATDRGTKGYGSTGQ